MQDLYLIDHDLDTLDPYIGAWGDSNGLHDEEEVRCVACCPFVDHTSQIEINGQSTICIFLCI